LSTIGPSAESSRKPGRLEKDRFQAHIQRMAQRPEMHLTQADLERAREIIAARAPVIGETGDLADRVTLAVAIGIAEGRA
jgi:hypothetical protein